MPYNSIYRRDLFRDHIFVITGGGSGIGRCTAHELAYLGAHVAIVGRNAAKLERVRSEIEDDGGSISTHVADIRDEDAVIATVERVLTDHGRIDGLVNNAGGQYRAALKTISTKGFEAVVKSNLTGGFIVMREVYNRWMIDHGGVIVNMIADIWHGWPHFSHSAAARGGMLTLSECAATEWAESGVRVNTVAPGSIASQGDCLSAVPGGKLHHRFMHPHRRRSTQRPPWMVGSAAGQQQCGLRRIPPVLTSRDPRRGAVIPVQSSVVADCRVAVLAGTAGVGLETASQLTEQGARVVLPGAITNAAPRRARRSDCERRRVTSPEICWHYPFASSVTLPEAFAAAA
jgi:NAD(P)-dependent dehydrogenase (short-subunit alcohol dehydrogenase family)